LIDLAGPNQGMLTEDMIPIVEKHPEEATGILIVGMGGSGKTTFLNALIEKMPKDWKYLFIQENEELFSDTRLNSDFLKTVKGINKYDVAHDLKELARNGLLMSIKCFIIGETKGDEAKYLFQVIRTGAVGITTLHADSSEHGLDTACNYIMYSTGYNKDQCMDMLTVLNKVFFLKDYRLREITTIRGYDFEKHQLICETEHYDPNPRK
jgi:flagellar protein FlaI